ncbi:MAG TPA: hypothetical protein VLQ80_14635 [Candidatus Saccharimonadia bacterium]|nr:hypothetical protein [Candidatus Saccharimonadia bacterium]
MSANPMDGLFHIDWTWLMTAQERKECRRVQPSRDLWKTRAVGRGEDRRRLRERRKEVDDSRDVWRPRALDAAHRSDQLALENHQRKSALTRVPPPSPIDTRHFFTLFVSPSRVDLSPLVPSVEPSAQRIASGGGWPDFLGASRHDGH